MKRQYAAAAVILLAVMLSSIGLAAADVTGLELTAKSQGHLWYIKTGDILGDGSLIVDGTHCTGMIAFYYELGNQYPVYYDRVVLTYDKITLYFDHKQLPAHADTIEVTGFVDGVPFQAAGEGFTFRTK